MLPRVTWHFTGPLALWPSSARCRVVRRATSQDLQLRRLFILPEFNPHAKSRTTANKLERILVVGSGVTNGRFSQSGGAEELAWVKRQRLGVLVTELGGGGLAPQRILAEMQKHNWVHLACEISQNTLHPLLSAIYLPNGKVSLEAIMSVPRRDGGTIFMLRSSEVAQSYIVQGESLPFAHGMIMAGYSAIITALWSLRAQDASAVTQQVYARLRHGENREDVRVAQVLHAAVGHLRAEVGEKAFVRWVPYIHVGQ
ncbi:hypothetical protein FRC12_005112 [Ceratobasidium sp. 428]|nr:hypothetical protein FRC12_005112 [Ceratobasidium sp. 428]